MMPTTPTHRRARGRRPALSLLTATAPPVLAACGGGTSSGEGSSAASSAPSGGTTEVVVGVPPAISGEIVGFAEEQGRFEGLDVSVTQLNGGAASVPALQGGSPQIAQPDVLSVVQGTQQGLMIEASGGTVPPENVADPVEGKPHLACRIATGDVLEKDPQAAEAFVAAVDEAGQEVEDDPQPFRDHLTTTAKTPPALSGSGPDLTTETSAEDVDGGTSAAMDLEIIGGSAPEGSKTYRPVGR